MLELIDSRTFHGEDTSENFKPSKINIHGHTPFLDVQINKYAININTGAGDRIGKLTAIDLPSKEFKSIKTVEKDIL